MKNFRTFIWICAMAFLWSPIGAHAYVISVTGSIWVDDPIAPNGNDSVLLDANGNNSDVEVNAAITVGPGGDILIEADDSVYMSPTGMLIAPGTGKVTIRADTDDLPGDSGDGISMDGAINAGSGAVELFTRGDITMGSVVTTTGDILITGEGNTSQGSGASISGGGLALMTAGTTTLQTATNNFETLAADVGGQLIYTDVDSLIVGSVTVAGMNVTGITTTNDDVKLTTIAGNLSIDNDVALGTGDLFLAVNGNTSQTAAISGGGLALMTRGTTTLQTTTNNFETLGADVGGQLIYKDVDSLTVGSVTVAGMNVTGITTTNDDVNIWVGGNLSVNAGILGSDLVFQGSGAGSMAVADSIIATQSLRVTSFDTLVLAVVDDLLISSAHMQLDVANILFDATGVALSDQLTFQILNAGALGFLSSPNFEFAGLSNGFELDTANFLGQGFVTARVLGPAAVPEPGTLALLGIGLFGMALARRRKT